MMAGPESEGAFQKVAAATGSPGITEPAGLGALWASLPDLSQIGTLPGCQLPLAIGPLPSNGKAVT